MIYVYECKECPELLEIEQKITEDPIKVCPQCGNEIKRVISNTSFLLKGKGWFKDGY